MPVDEVVFAASNTAPEAPASPTKSPNIPHPARIAHRSPSRLHPTPHIRQRTRRAGTATLLAALVRRVVRVSCLYSRTSLSLLLTQILPSKRSLGAAQQSRLARWLRPEKRRYWSSVGKVHVGSSGGGSRRRRRRGGDSNEVLLARWGALERLRRLCSVERAYASDTRARDDEESPDTVRLLADARADLRPSYSPARQGCEPVYRLPSESPGISCMRILFILPLPLPAPHRPPELSIVVLPFLATISNPSESRAAPSPQRHLIKSSAAHNFGSQLRNPPSAPFSSLTLACTPRIAALLALLVLQHFGLFLSACSLIGPGQFTVALGRVHFTRYSVVAERLLRALTDPVPYRFHLEVGGMAYSRALRNRQITLDSPDFRTGESPYVPSKHPPLEARFLRPSNPPARPDFRIVERSGAPRLPIAPPMLSSYPRSRCPRSPISDPRLVAQACTGLTQAPHSAPPPYQTAPVVADPH
ncbi:hypothetical protein C8J57DRAFT_1620611 [Mycena rebaudengoi]|nr:hypothetical protein C8J57DRAFT_1620611 [Mycena rebaudengoi]